MNNIEKLLEDSLLIIWNDRDANSRAAAMKNVYTDDIVFYESNSSPAIIGHQSINDLIAKLQSQWPLDFRFQLTQPASVNHEVQHIAWILGVPSEAPVASGMDIAVIEHGKIRSLHLFLDAPVKA